MKQVKQKVWPRLLILGAMLFISALGADAASGFPSKVASHFLRYWNVSQQEKVYLHTDKPYYCAGENIWFKAYLVNAVSHLPKSMSKFIYVELIDKANVVVSRVKVRRDSIGFAGFIKLSPEIQPGAYALRAYTAWMQNAGADYFFVRQLTIVNPLDDNVQVAVSFDPVVRGRQQARFTFTDVAHKPLAAKAIDVIQSWNNPDEKRKTYYSNKDGRIAFTFEPDTTLKTAAYFTVSISDPLCKLSHKYYIPDLSHDFDVSFFPEGGSLISNSLQMIGFKAIGRDGLSVDVNGKIYNSRNEEVTEISSFYKGMGKFTIQVDSGETYYAVLKNSAGVIKRIELPRAVNQGITLHLLSNRSRIFYEVINHSAVPDNQLCLLLHQRGRMLVTLPITALQGELSENALPPGILSFAIVDTLGNTYCERLHFVKPRQMQLVGINSDKPVYGKREKVEMDIQLKPTDATAVAGSYSLSVTDSKVVNQDSTADNIVTNLLLTSDLKGYVENPGSYFSNNDALDHERLDVLLLTQGWRRFSTANVVKGIYPRQDFYMEAGQVLTGKVLNVLNKPSKKCGVIAISPYRKLIKIAQTDSLGRYLIDGIEFPDSTTFILKAKKAKSITDVEIVPDADDFPKSTVFIPWLTNTDPALNDDFILQSKQKYFAEGGMRVVDLRAVTVTASRINKESETHFYSGMEDVKFGPDKLEKYPGMGVLQILAMLPGIQVSDEDVRIRGARGNPTFYIDDIEAMGMDEITYLNQEDIQDISVFKGANTAIFGSKGAYGVVAITLKKGVVRKASNSLSLNTISPLGYQKALEFYSPRYDVNPDINKGHADLRTTIYWNPKLVPDANGLIHVSFFTADRANNYNLTLEGISSKGEICHHSGVLIRKGE